MNSTDHIDMNKGLRRKEAARVMGCSTATLDRLERSGRAPKRNKFGRICTYTLRSILEWRDAQQAGGAR